MPSPSLTPSERALRARLAALTRWSQQDAVAGTEKARSASPCADDYWLRQVDPDGVLSDEERARRAAAAKKAHYTRLALKSAQARRRRRPDAA